MIQTSKLYYCLSFLFSHSCAHMRQIDFISSIFDRFFPQNYLGLFTDHTLQMYRLVSPHCLSILPYCANSGDSLRSAYIYMCRLVMVLYQIAFLGQTVYSMYTCRLVSVFCSRQFSVKQLNLKLTSPCVNILITVFFRVLKINIILMVLTFLTASSHQVKKV